MENLFDYLFMLLFIVSALIFISDWSDPYIFRRKMEKTRSVREEMEGNVFFPARVGICSL